MNPPARTNRRYPAQDPSRRFAGWAVVVALHILIAYGLVTGTARKGLEILKKPLEAVVIQEVIIPPPPPPPPKEIKQPEPKAPKSPVPPPFVPPPEVTPPVSTAPTIVSMPTPPPTPAVIEPPPPPAPAAPSRPARAEMSVVCPTQAKPEMPRQAIREGVEGVVRAQALIRDGSVKEVTILSGPRVLHAAVRNAMLQYKCVSEGGDVIATQEFVFKIE